MGQEIVPAGEYRRISAATDELEGLIAQRDMSEAGGGHRSAGCTGGGHRPAATS